MPDSTAFRTGDQALVREINLSLILSRLAEGPPLSRAGLAEATGLNKSTVSSLVQELIDMQFVRETGLSSTGVGRPAMQLTLNPQAGCIISCELGVGFLLVVCANFAAEIIWRHHEYTDGYRSQAAIIERLREVLAQAVEAARAVCGDCGGLLGLAVGAPGLVDQRTGTLLFAPNLGWTNVPLYRILREDFGDVLLFVENEANMAAMGEYFFGQARGFRDVVSISVGVGLGGAVIRGGRLIRGATGFAGEFGHMTMDPDGLLCNCGNRGCWETQVCESALFRYVREAIAQGAASSLGTPGSARLDHLTVAQVAEAATQGDQAAREALGRVGRYLGIGMASLVNAFNPDLMVLGGTLSVAGDTLLPAIRAELDARALRWNRDAMTVALAHHRSDAAVMGGVAMVYQSVLAQPGSIVRRGL